MNNKSNKIQEWVPVMSSLAKALVCSMWLKPLVVDLVWQLVGNKTIIRNDNAMDIQVYLYQKILIRNSKNDINYVCLDFLSWNSANKYTYKLQNKSINQHVLLDIWC